MIADDPNTTAFAVAAPVSYALAPPWRTMFGFCDRIRQKAQVRLNSSSFLLLVVLTYLTMVASCDRSKRCAASAAETIAPSKAERSQTSSTTKNFRAKLKKAAGPFEALTAMTCFGLAAFSGVLGYVVSEVL